MKKYDYTFVEVGVTYGKYEFYHCFMFPVNLTMRRFNMGAMERVSVEDWLKTDFITLLGSRLHLSNMRNLKLSYLSSFRPSLRRECVAISSGNSLPDSWINPIISLIAESFLNTYANEK